VNSDLEGTREQAAVASFLYRPGIFQELLRKATKNISHTNQPQGFNLRRYEFVELDCYLVWSLRYA